jgi:hypothetical protein
MVALGQGHVAFSDLAPIFCCAVTARVLLGNSQQGRRLPDFPWDQELAPGKPL